MRTHLGPVVLKNSNKMLTENGTKMREGDIEEIFKDFELDDAGHFNIEKFSEKIIAGYR